MRVARLRSVFLAVFFACLVLPAHAQEKQTVPAEGALKYHGQSITVCGKVAGSRYAGKIKGRPTLLHLEKPYPEHLFTIVIWAADRGRF